MKKSVKLALSSFLVLALALAGCGKTEGGSSAEQPQPEQGQAAEAVSLEIGMLKLTSSAPLFIGIEKGFFQEEGIDAKAKWFDAAQPIAVATAAGSVDVGATGITASLYNMVSGGQKLVIVADKGREQAGYSSSALLYPSDSPLKSIEELKGKKLGITQTGSTYHYMAGKLLEKHGLTLQDIELIPLNNIKGLMEALKSKQVDAVLLNEPNISTVVEEGYGKVIAQVGDEMEYQTSGIFFSPKFAENKDAAQRFLKAYAKATQYYYDAVLNKVDGKIVPGENYDEVVNIIAKYTDQEADMIKKGMPYMDRDGKLLESDIKTQVEWYAKEKLIDKVIDTSEIVNTQLLEDALKN
ncbi:ABC transporter substrate-binding protein [Brevibacillus invocatus]|uniref:ABC transporter substrate-binding protein n=1 Tax=Brevibacillus invocatus TaxID=173959 RepID=UPI00204108DF|nr:ABC transporter substrate-binding protein [Brevibacillus invocatus]MCM3077710.1 ABC transporter substrate-binding protein [Brevibacillus invocatus]MCM3428711.1 ABC transporter substrate-binding protein [Brevibacillus invocatus]